jgi:predicted  nucleic acid-binding Zn-ribbon protein
MKKVFTVMLSLIGFGMIYSQETAQTNTGLTTEKKQMSLGIHQAYNIVIPAAKLKDIETLWSKYTTRNTKSKSVNNKGEWTVIGAVEKNITPTSFNVYATILATVKDVRLSIFLAEGDTNQLTFISKDSSAPEKILAVEKYLTDFKNLATRDAIEQELDLERKGLKTLQADLKSMEKDFDKSNKNVSEAKRKIEKNESEIRRIDVEVEAKNGHISHQKHAITTMTTLGDAKKTAQKDLAAFESEKKKLHSDKEKMSKEIDKCRAEIRNEEKAIEKLNVTKAAKQADVTKQENKVKSVEDRLNAIPNPGIKL